MAKSSSLGLDSLIEGYVEPVKPVRQTKPKKTKEPSIDYLSQPISSFTIHPTSLTTVPNEHPILNQPYRIAIIGEAPGRDEELQGKPFVGISGQVLTNLLSKAGIVRAASFIGNICQKRPVNNDVTLAEQDDIEEGIKRLDNDLKKFNPNICLLLGSTALHAAKDNCSIGDWRGSFFISDKLLSPFYGRKCIASYHPAACLRQYEWLPLLMFDIKKCMTEALTPSLSLPRRELTTELQAGEICNRLNKINQLSFPISIDIEGGINSMSCISIAISPYESFIIPFTDSHGDNYWSFEDELDIWSVLSSVLANPKIPKILQNALYDRFVLQYSYSLCICSNTEDTMLKSWELYCELEKGLGFLCSLYTKEPFYKSDRKSSDIDTFWKYCCKDSAVTYEISDKIEPMLVKESKEHYRFNVEMLNPMLYMELKGIKYDTEKAKEKLKQVQAWIFRLQNELDALAGMGCAGKSREDILKFVQETMCFVRDQNAPKKAYQEIYPKIKTILAKQTELTIEDVGFVSIQCNLSLNIKSTKFKTYLYETLNLPKQYSKPDDEGKKHLTTDGKALLKIQKLTKDNPHPAVALAIQVAELRTRAQMLHISADEDGRIRCGYNVVGASTGRITCYTSPTGSGYNLQTIPDDYDSYDINHPLRHGMRDLFLADEGYHLFQCDLKGSDGWTIGANLASLGDPTMLDDLRFGIKPASRICYMLRHGNSSLLRKPRDEVKELLKEIKKTDWDYFFCKIGIWGVCYLMGPDLLAEEMMEESQGKLVKSRKEIEDFRNAVLTGYNVKLWHNNMQRRLDKKPELIVPSGHKRRFFGRKTEILGQALAHEPQANTTYATNKAAVRLWRDRENRIYENGTSQCQLKIQPLHQVHDALIGQFKISDTHWAINKIKSYFDNEIIIAGIPITIPFEGNYGDNWANLNKGTI